MLLSEGTGRPARISSLLVSLATLPEEIESFVDGRFVRPASGEWVQKLRPADGTPLCRVARSGEEDVAAAVAAARAAQPAWTEHAAGACVRLRLAAHRA